MMLPRTLLVLALSASSLAWGAPAVSPERLPRLRYFEGEVAFQDAERLVTQAGGRAELTLGTATVRLDEDTELSIATLNATTVRLELNRGTASVYLRELIDDEAFEVETPNTTLVLREPGEYRIAVPTDGLTDLTVRGGAADAMTAGGPVRVADGQRVRLEGREALANLVTPRSADDFDDWVLERELQFAELESSPEQFAGDDEYLELDDYGVWYDEPSYGRVWMPSYGYGGYDPFRHGYWGHWTYLDNWNRWCWVPEPRHRGRHVETAPFGRPRPDRKGERPVLIAQPDTKLRRPVATSAGVDSASNPPQRNAPAPQPGGKVTFRPARPAESRTTAPAPPANSNKEFGTFRTP